jgi:ligand-binding sensor protein
VHFAVPLVLGGHPLGALVAGQVFDQHAEQLTPEHTAKMFVSPQVKVWEKARSHGQIWLHLNARGS